MGLTCPVCKGIVSVVLTKKRNGLHFKCERDPRHYRGFIMDRPYVEELKRQAGV
jgi:hypothetical protein